MKTIGLIGGMSWESTQVYYKKINEAVRASLGGLHSAKIVLFSVDFAEIEVLQHQGKWDETAIILQQAAQAVEAGSADFFLICTNTMHKVAPAVESSVAIPLLHIADATGAKLKRNGIRKVGLLGTRFTMEQDFYKDRITQNFDIEVLIPSEQDREIVHNVIYQELCLGNIQDASRIQYLDIIERLVAQGAEAVILGCTEITLLVQQQHTSVPLYDTTDIHAQEAVKRALS